MGKYVHHSDYFYGNKISDYGLEHHRVDYRTLAKSFDAVLNNEILQKTSGVGYWELENGSFCYYEDTDGNRLTEEEYCSLSYEEQERCSEYVYDVYQWWIVSDQGAEILKELTEEIVYYNEELDMYVWGVTHWGTAWDYVLTDIEIETNGANE